jgi:hypothetical protein
MNIAVRLAAGFDPFTGQSREPVAVLYVDGEMGRLDLEERIFDLGFDPVDLENFYACDLAPFLDEPAGGRKVLRTALHYRCQLVVIDGLNGTLMGDENDNTSLRNFFDHTVRPLKSHEIAICSGDNTGKDVSKGPRGTSVKLDKPDAVYRLQRTDNGVKVVAVVSRSSAFVREVDYNIEGLEGDTPLTYRPEGTSWPDGTLKAARLLEHHNIPLDWGRRKVRQRLRELGVDGFRNHILDAGQKYRRKMFNNTEVRTLVDHAKQGS